MSGSQLIPTNTFATQSGNIALSLLDTNFSQVASFLNNPNNYTNYLVDSGGANAYVVTFPTGVIPSSYTAGLTVVMKVANANTGASTLNVNSLGVKNILTPSGGALSSGTLAANAIVMVVYDGTQFILVGGSTSTSIANGTSNVTVNSSGGTITAATNGTTAVTIDTSQNVGIGTASPGYKLALESGSNFAIHLLKTSSNDGWVRNIGNLDLAAASGGGSGQLITFSNGANYAGLTERMRIDGSGVWYLNTTDSDAYITSSTSQTGFTYRPGLAPRLSLVNDFYINRSNGNGNIFEFRRNGSAVGTITVSAGATAYNTSSDYRLKEAIVPMTGALAKVALLKPCTYKWKADGLDGQGFIAHELDEVVPGCVTGEKDAVDADNNPVYQGIDTSFLVATLTAAIQELKAINDTQAETINALTARVVALESK